MRDLRRLLSYLKPHRTKLLSAILAMFAVGILDSAVLALIAPIIDQAFNSGATQAAARTQTLFNLERLIPSSGVGAWKVIALLLLIFTIAKGIAEYFSTYLMASVGQSTVMTLRADMYRHLLAQSADFYERHRSNYLVSRLINSTAAIETTITATLRDMLRDGWKFIAFIGSAFYMSWRLTLIIFAIAPLVAFLTARFGKAMRRVATESHIGSQRLTDTAQEALANHNIVKAYAAEATEQNRFRRVADEIVRANLRTAKLSGIAPPTIETIGVIAIVVLLFFGQREIAIGRLNTPQFLTFIALIFAAADPMRRLSRLHIGLEQGFAAAHHVWEVMDEHRETKSKSNAVSLFGLKRAITLRDVSFKYASHEIEHLPTLDNINLVIPARSIVALVGESGSGKSTLTKLIPRFHDPTHGAILWDETDIRDADLKSLRSHIAIVTQETTLFNDTIRYNIAYGKPEANPDEIERAARIALAHDFINQLPDGYDTIVGERGVFLSGGQRQRLAIARAILINAPILILDEATSALDTQSERLVQQALRNLMQDRTTIVIAHRLSTIRRADKIVVMTGGKIIETGSHNDLLQQGGTYKRLYELQFAEDDDDNQAATDEKAITDKAISSQLVGR